MPFFRPAMAAAALVVVAFTAPAIATAASNPIITVDYNRVYKESAAGKSAQDQLKTLANKVSQELQPEATGIDNDSKSLGFAGKSQAQVMAAINADKSLQARVGKLQQRQANFMQRQELRQQELQATSQKAINDVLALAKPVVEQVMHDRKAAVAFETNGTIAHDPSTDVTNDVIAGLNKRSQTVQVSMVDLTKQQ